MTQKELKKILEDHKKWVIGKGGKKANLCGADLRGADLHEADLFGVNLCGADLFGANLCEAQLFEVNLCGADLFGANLCEAYLGEADLHKANLCKANLCKADLRRANLCRADIREANLLEANLYGADLYEADLCGAKNVPFIPMACPETGSFIGWKKVYNNDNGQKYIIKLQIPEKAKRSSSTGRQCRCEFAKVLKIENLDGTIAEINSVNNRKFAGAVYTVGEMVYPDAFDEDRFNECSHGIHFYTSRHEAMEYWV